MAVWGDHTKTMDHLLRRAAERLGKVRTNMSSQASRMDKLSPIEERKAQYVQRNRDKSPNRLNRHQD